MKKIFKSWFPTDGKTIANAIRGWANVALAFSMILFVFCVVFFFLSLILTPLLDLDFEDLAGVGAICVGGAVSLVFLAYFHRLFLFSFAAWTEASSIYIEHACDKETKPVKQANVDHKRLKKLEKLRSQGLISKEEYQQVISKEQ